MDRYVLDRLMDRSSRSRNSRGQFTSRGQDGRSGDGRSGDGRGRSRRGGDGRRGRDSRDSDYGSNDGRRGRDGFGGYDDYDDYRDFEYNHESRIELQKEDIEEWLETLKNADGSRGAKFSREQILNTAKQKGIEFQEFTEDEFYMTVNMLYSDFCKAMKHSGAPNAERPELYVLMAKAWLCDEDFEGEPYEKLALYFYTIVEFED